MPIVHHSFESAQLSQDRTALLRDRPRPRLLEVVVRVVRQSKHADMGTVARRQLAVRPGGSVGEGTSLERPRYTEPREEGVCDLPALREGDRQADRDRAEG